MRTQRKLMLLANSTTNSQKQEHKSENVHSTIDNEAETQNGKSKISTVEARNNRRKIRIE
jgi:hypothetical protein